MSGPTGLEAIEEIVARRARVARARRVARRRDRAAPGRRRGRARRGRRLRRPSTSATTSPAAPACSSRGVVRGSVGAWLTSSMSTRCWRAFASAREGGAEPSAAAGRGARPPAVHRRRRRPTTSTSRSSATRPGRSTTGSSPSRSTSARRPESRSQSLASVASHTQRAACQGRVRRQMRCWSSSDRPPSSCCRNARSTATQIVFENGYQTIGPIVISGTKIASINGTGTSGTGEDHRDEERHREHPADAHDVDRERAGPVALLALEVQPAARAVGHHREVVTEQLARTAARAARGEAAGACDRRLRLVVTTAQRSGRSARIRRSQRRRRVLPMRSWVIVGHHVGVARVGQTAACRRAGARRRSRRSAMPSRSITTDVASIVIVPVDDAGRFAAGSASTSAWVTRRVDPRERARGRGRPHADRVLRHVPAERGGEPERTRIGAAAPRPCARSRASGSCSPARRRSRARR